MNDKPLQTLRDKIDALDTQLVKLLADRFMAVREVALLKQTLNMPSLSTERFNAILTLRKKQALALNLDTHFIEAIFEQIHKASLNLQEKLKQE